VVGFELNLPFKELYNTNEILLGGVGGSRTRVRKQKQDKFSNLIRFCCFREIL
jgi:hypothetical protein